MRKSSAFTISILAAVLLFSVTQSQAGPHLPPLPPPPGVSVHIDGFLPPPPGVHVYVDGDRRYYKEGGRRVYMKKDPKYNKKHDDNGYRDHGRGHGKDKHKD